jgi:DNA-binding transcriptional LysR family regulator
MDINYELYKVFYHVAVTLSFSEASKQLFISQSAVSQSIKVLEKKLKQPLFIRSTKKVQLTPEGEILLKHIEPAMNLIQKGENQLLYLKRRPAAYWRQRHHLPLLSGTLLKTVPQRIPQHSYQSDQPHFH